MSHSQETKLFADRLRYINEHNRYDLTMAKEVSDKLPEIVRMLDMLYVAQKRAETPSPETDLKQLSDAYLRLRAIIPGAYDTPHAPTAQQVWDTTEKAAQKLSDQKNHATRLVVRLNALLGPTFQREVEQTVKILTE